MNWLLVIYFVTDALVHVAFKSSKAISIFSKALLSPLYTRKIFRKCRWENTTVYDILISISFNAFN